MPSARIPQHSRTQSDTSNVIVASLSECSLGASMRNHRRILDRRTTSQDAQLSPRIKSNTLRPEQIGDGVQNSVEKANCAGERSYKSVVAQDWGGGAHPNEIQHEEAFKPIVQEKASKAVMVDIAIQTDDYEEETQPSCCTGPCCCQLSELPPRRQKPNKTHRRVRSDASLPDYCDSLYVGGLGLGVTEQDLYDFFGAYGDISSLTIKSLCEPSANRFAFISFKRLEVTEHVANQFFKCSAVINGCKLVVQRAGRKDMNRTRRLEIANPPPDNSAVAPPMQLPSFIPFFNFCPPMFYPPTPYMPQMPYFPPPFPPANVHDPNVYQPVPPIFCPPNYATGGTLSTGYDGKAFPSSSASSDKSVSR